MNFKLEGAQEPCPPHSTPSTTFVFWRRDDVGKATRSGQDQIPESSARSHTTASPATGVEPTLALERKSIPQELAEDREGEKLVPRIVCVLAMFAWKTTGEAWVCQAESGPPGVSAGGSSSPLQWSPQAHTCQGGKGGRTLPQGHVQGDWTGTAEEDGQERTRS